MIKKFTQLVSAAAVFAATTLGFSSQASALETVKQGTFTIAAERLTSVNLVFGGGSTELSLSLLNQNTAAPYQFPRIGADYFIIDGLSLGGHVGFGHYTGGGGITQLVLIPRVGYAFAIADKIDFWPRAGIGLLVSDPGNTSGLVTLEGTFVYNAFEHVGFEFGPNLDIGLGDNSATTLGGNAGILVKF